MSGTSATAWSCPECGRPLGRITRSGDLVITSPATTVELSRLAVVARCVCGGVRAFSGRRVLMDVPTRTPETHQDTLQSA